jgi:hypothetical protein
MSEAKNLKNKVFGKLTIIERVGSNKHGKALWRCKCSCGNIVTIDSNSLISGNTKSCGCMKLDLVKNLNSKHHMSHTRFYYVWQAMIRRCNDPKQKTYQDYGGRGIKVCNRWESSFENFYEDMFKSYSPGLTLERIDVNKGYSKDNCIWATYKKQMRNTRRNKNIKINSCSLCITDACRLIGIKLPTLYSTASRNGLSLQEAFNFHLKNKIDKIASDAWTAL